METNSLKIDSLKNLLESHYGIFVKQVKEWAEILIDWETKNKYEIQDPTGQSIGAIAERPGGVFDHIKRFILRSHRPLRVDVFDQKGLHVLHLTRSFFFFFSDLYVSDGDARPIGSIHRRFGIIYKKYDLRNRQGHTFARVESPLWRLWTFPIYSHVGREVGVITKKWTGLLKEAFTDADQFFIDFSKNQWSLEQRAILLATAISIDFDFFENNQGVRDGVLDF